VPKIGDVSKPQVYASISRGIRIFVSSKRRKVLISICLAFLPDYMGQNKTKRIFLNLIIFFLLVLFTKNLIKLHLRFVVQYTPGRTSIMRCNFETDFGSFLLYNYVNCWLHIQSHSLILKLDLTNEIRIEKKKNWKPRSIVWI
jgi:hypothetical protein